MTSPLVCRTFLCISDVIIAMQYYREITRLVAGETRQKLSRDVMAFAKQWMQFVLQRCERGRGMTSFVHVPSSPRRRILYLLDLRDDSSVRSALFFVVWFACVDISEVRKAKIDRMRKTRWKTGKDIRHANERCKRWNSITYLRGFWEARSCDIVIDSLTFIIENCDRNVLQMRFMSVFVNFVTVIIFFFS